MICHFYKGGVIKYPDSGCSPYDEDSVGVWLMFGVGVGTGILFILTLLGVWECLARLVTVNILVSWWLKG